MAEQSAPIIPRTWEPFRIVPTLIGQRLGIGIKSILEPLVDAVRLGHISHRIASKRAPEGWMPDIQQWLAEHKSKPRLPPWMVWRSNRAVVADWDGANPDWQFGTVEAWPPDRCEVMLCWVGGYPLSSVKRWMDDHRQIREAISVVGRPTDEIVTALQPEPEKQKASYNRLLAWMINRISNWPVGSLTESESNTLGEASRTFDVSRSLVRDVLTNPLLQSFKGKRNSPKKAWSEADAAEFAEIVKRHQASRLAAK